MYDKRVEELKQQAAEKLAALQQAAQEHVQVWPAAEAPTWHWLLPQTCT